MAHPAFLVALCQHGDSVRPRFPDHPPEVGHRAGQRTLSGDELIGTEITLEQTGKDTLKMNTHRFNG